MQLQETLTSKVMKNIPKTASIHRKKKKINASVNSPDTTANISPSSNSLGGKFYISNKNGLRKEEVNELYGNNVSANPKKNIRKLSKSMNRKSKRSYRLLENISGTPTQSTTSVLTDETYLNRESVKSTSFRSFHHHETSKNDEVAKNDRILNEKIIYSEHQRDAIKKKLKRHKKYILNDLRTNETRGFEHWSNIMDVDSTVNLLVFDKTMGWVKSSNELTKCSNVDVNMISNNRFRTKSATQPNLVHERQEKDFTCNIVTKRNIKKEVNNSYHSKVPITESESNKQNSFGMPKQSEIHKENHSFISQEFNKFKLPKMRYEYENIIPETSQSDFRISFAASKARQLKEVSKLIRQTILHQSPRNEGKDPQDALPDAIICNRLGMNIKLQFYTL